MSGGWVDSNRRAELPADWYTTIRPHILQRDEHRCRWRESGRACGRPANQVDHIGDRHDHRPENLQALCEWHHDRKTSRQGNLSPNRAKITEARTRERHPGLM
ncbi:HNH endonuclease [Streptomyces sp. NPDC059165]|uniref:HNH endonuclease n=1 Tax=Streptomyces sp. NPDC059165 TaxID=3346751 RepID=UPI0036A29854